MHPRSARASGLEHHRLLDVRMRLCALQNLQQAPGATPEAQASAAGARSGEHLHGTQVDALSEYVQDLADAGAVVDVHDQ